MQITFSIDFIKIGEFVLKYKEIFLCIIDVLTIVFVIKTYYETRKNDSSLAEDKIIEMLMNAEEKVFDSIVNKKDKKEIDAWKERYINILDIICYKYLNNKIDTDMFESCLSDIVKNANEDSEYSKFIKPNTAKNIISAYNKITKTN